MSADRGHTIGKRREHHLSGEQGNAPSDNPIDFIRLKYGDHFPGHIVLFNKRSRASYCFSKDEMAALEQAIAREAPAADLYIALGTQLNRLTREKRGSTDTVMALPGFVADVDFAAVKSTSKRYPANEDEARRLLGLLPFQPTAIVQTGNGLHAHFDLRELLVVSTTDELRAAKETWSKFQRALAAHFRAHGREIDSVGDLIRNYLLFGVQF